MSPSATSVGGLKLASTTLDFHSRELEALRLASGLEHELHLSDVSEKECGQIWKYK